MKKKKNAKSGAASAGRSTAAVEWTGGKEEIAGKEVEPHLYLFSFSSMTHMSNCLGRLSCFLEDLTYYGQVFSMVEFQSATEQIASKSYLGHNFPLQRAAEFFTQVLREDRVEAAEAEFLGILARLQLLQYVHKERAYVLNRRFRPRAEFAVQRVYCICTTQAGSDSALASTLAHERKHARFFQDDAYREAVEALWGALPPPLLAEVTALLARLGYHEAVHVDEWQAFLLTESGSWWDKKDLVESNGYTIESFNVTTKDGYILTVFEITNSSARARGEPVILQHGLLDSGFTWVVNTPSESLAYLLADRGFTVFLGNSRGSEYSLGHTAAVSASDYWAGVDFDLMAQFDLPALLGAVQARTAAVPHYVGHSQGTIEMFAALSSGALSGAELRSFNALGPVTHVGHEQVLAFRILADLDTGEWLRFFGEKQFLPTFSGAEKVLFEAACHLCGRCCEDVIELICGPHSPNTFNDSRLPLVVAHEPGGTSVRNMQHWAQLVRSGRFEMFDYGSAEANRRHYGQLTPPQYDMAKFPKQLPTFLWSGSNDELADPADVKALVATLRADGLQTFNATEIQGYAHLDFVWAVDANDRVYRKMNLFQ